LPSYQWQHDGWNVKFEPIPKLGEHRGEQAVTPIGLTMPLQVQRLAPDEGIKKALEAKSKYAVTLPLLVAVNVMDDFCKTYDVMNALFGHETVLFSATGTRPGERIPDGAWVGPQGPRNRSISAAFIFHDLQVWNIKQDKRWIVHNPWSDRPLGAGFLPFSQYLANHEQGTMRLIDGNTTVSGALGLPDPWPPEEQDPDQSTFDILRKSLDQLADKVSLAFVYGSMARQEEKAESDIDLMVVGDATLEDIVTQLSEVERWGGRPVNPTVYSVDEFRAKLANGQHFLSSVVRREKIFLVGDENELRKVAGESLAYGGTNKSQ
jgi:predicted nucleotidyltransferase